MVATVVNACVGPRPFGEGERVFGRVRKARDLADLPPAGRRHGAR
jgi:hypothetical protein